MDKDIVRWVLDFLLRQPLDDRTFNALVRILPLSDSDSNMKRLFLLRKIEAELAKGPISEDVLEILEYMEELEFLDGKEITVALKNAYCAVAVNCTVRLMEQNGMEKYFEAVKRIWRMRVGQMEKVENVGLVSDELIGWRDEMEAAIWDESVWKKLLLKTKGIDALETLRVYVKEAKENVGPSFIELVAATLDESALKLLGMGNEDTSKDTVQSRRKHIALKQFKKLNSRTTRGAKIVESDDLGVGTSHDKYGCLSTPEITKLQEALRSSSSDLRAVVKDPLPEALQMAKNVVSNMSSDDKSTDGVNVVEADKSNNERKGSIQQTNAPRPSLMAKNVVFKLNSVDKNADGIHVVEADKSNNEKQGSIQQTNAPRPSLMAKNVVSNTDSVEKYADGVHVVDADKNNNEKQGSIQQTNAPRPSLVAKNVVSKLNSVDKSADDVDIVEADGSNYEKKGSLQQTNAPRPSLMATNVVPNMDSVDKSTDIAEADKSNYVKKGSIQQTNAFRPSLMARNSTARTYEWDESIDGSSDHASRPHLPTPKKRAVSPLKKYEKPKPLRRKRRFWSSLEEDTLRTGVQKYGVGNWKFILNTYKDIFDERTEVDLKDKWRNLIK